MALTDFIPSRHGFNFSNDFVNKITVLGLISLESHGLCGGMALAALRYYLNRVPIPNHRSVDFSPGTCPPEGSRLYNYILQCQIESWGPTGVWGTTQWRTMPWVSLEQQFRWSFTDSSCEFLKVKKSIDLSLPVVIGLRPITSDPSGLHTVLAIGYDESPRRVYVYDSDMPDSIMELRADNAAHRITYQTKDASPSAPAWGSFFIPGADPYGNSQGSLASLISLSDYPSYVDLALESGVYTSSPTYVGDRAVLSAVVSNRGDNSTMAKRMLLSVEDPLGATTEACSVSLALPLLAGERRQIVCNIPSLGTKYGTYRITAQYESLNGFLIDLPALGSGTVNPVSIYLRPVSPPLDTCRELASKIKQAQKDVDQARNRVEELSGGDAKTLAAAQAALQRAIKLLAELTTERTNLGCP